MLRKHYRGCIQTYKEGKVKHIALCIYANTAFRCKRKEVVVEPVCKGACKG